MATVTFEILFKTVTFKLLHLKVMAVVCMSRILAKGSHFNCLSGSLDCGSISLEALSCSLSSLAHAVLPIELHAISQ